MFHVSSAVCDGFSLVKGYRNCDIFRKVFPLNQVCIKLQHFKYSVITGSLYLDTSFECWSIPNFQTEFSQHAIPFWKDRMKFYTLRTAKFQFQLSSVKWKDSWGKKSKLNIDKERIGTRPICNTSSPGLEGVPDVLREILRLVKQKFLYAFVCIWIGIRRRSFTTTTADIIMQKRVIYKVLSFFKWQNTKW